MMWCDTGWEGRRDSQECRTNDGNLAEEGTHNDSLWWHLLLSMKGRSMLLACLESLLLHSQKSLKRPTHQCHGGQDVAPPDIKTDPRTPHLSPNLNPLALEGSSRTTFPLSLRKGGWDVSHHKRFQDDMNCRRKRTGVYWSIFLSRDLFLRSSLGSLGFAFVRVAYEIPCAGIGSNSTSGKDYFPRWKYNFSLIKLMLNPPRTSIIVRWGSEV